MRSRIVDSEISQAWLKAAHDLQIRVVAPFARLASFEQITSDWKTLLALRSASNQDSESSASYCLRMGSPSAS